MKSRGVQAQSWMASTPVQGGQQFFQPSPQKSSGRFRCHSVLAVRVCKLECLSDLLKMALLNHFRLVGVLEDIKTPVELKALNVIYRCGSKVRYGNSTELPNSRFQQKQNKQSNKRNLEGSIFGVLSVRSFVATGNNRLILL